MGRSPPPNAALSEATCDMVPIAATRMLEGATLWCYRSPAGWSTQGKPHALHMPNRSQPAMGLRQTLVVQVLHAADAGQCSPLWPDTPRPSAPSIPEARGRRGHCSRLFLAEAPLRDHAQNLEVLAKVHWLRFAPPRNIPLATSAACSFAL